MAKKMQFFESKTLTLTSRFPSLVNILLVVLPSTNYALTSIDYLCYCPCLSSTACSNYDETSRHFDAWIWGDDDSAGSTFLERDGHSCSYTPRGHCTACLLITVFDLVKSSLIRRECNSTYCIKLGTVSAWTAIISCALLRHPVGRLD